MRRMRSCSSPATRCTAASADSPPSITSATRFSQPGIGGDQAIGLQHLARCRRVRAAAHAIRHAGDQLVETLLHALRGLVQAGQFGRRVVGQQAHRAAPVAVQHDRADGDAGDQRRAGEHPRHGGGDALLRAVGGAGRGQHLGQQHRHGLQFVHFLLGVAARIAVLHRDHAQSAAGAAHRHGEHGGERLLAGLRTVGEGGMVLRVRQVHHLRRWRRTGRRCPRRRAAGCGRRPAGSGPRWRPAPGSRRGGRRRPSRPRSPARPPPGGRAPATARSHAPSSRAAGSHAGGLRRGVAMARGLSREPRSGVATSSRPSACADQLRR